MKKLREKLLLNEPLLRRISYVLELKFKSFLTAGSQLQKVIKMADVDKMMVKFLEKQSNVLGLLRKYHALLL